MAVGRCQARRVGPPYGALLLLSVAGFVYVPLINTFARMDNASLGNGILGLFLILLGVTLLIGSLAGYGARAWPNRQKRRLF